MKVGLVTSWVFAASTSTLHVFDITVTFGVQIDRISYNANTVGNDMCQETDVRLREQ